MRLADPGADAGGDDHAAVSHHIDAETEFLRELVAEALTNATSNSLPPRRPVNPVIIFQTINQEEKEVKDRIHSRYFRSIPERASFMHFLPIYFDRKAKVIDRCFEKIGPKPKTLAFGLPLAGPGKGSDGAALAKRRRPTQVFCSDFSDASLILSMSDHFDGKRFFNPRVDTDRSAGGGCRGGRPPGRARPAVRPACLCRRWRRIGSPRPISARPASFYRWPA